MLQVPYVTGFCEPHVALKYLGLPVTLQHFLVAVSTHEISTITHVQYYYSSLLVPGCRDLHVGSVVIDGQPCAAD